MKTTMRNEEGNSENAYENKIDIRRSFYKNPIKKYNLRLEFDYDTSQDVRRKTLLEFQKKYRDETVNTVRGILQDKFLFELDDEPMDVENRTTKSIRHHKSRYKVHRIMMSEWMIDVPQDFIENWIMVPCPVGKRTILVANKGITKAYTRKGQIVATFCSALPGGNTTCNRFSSVVDCIWVESKKLYYILDVLAWGKQTMINCEAEFRFFWINSKMNEMKELKERDTEINIYPILSLPSISCSSDLSLALTEFDDLYPLDGLLFYHAKAQYSFGYTPLVTWLKTFMLPEVLGLFVPPPYDDKPDGYIDYKHYICQVTRNKRKKKYLQSLWNL